MKAYLAELEEQCDDLMQELKEENPEWTLEVYTDEVLSTLDQFIPEANMLRDYVVEQIPGYYYESTSHTPAYLRN